MGVQYVRRKRRDNMEGRFRTNHGLYEPMVMFFGLTNSLQHTKHRKITKKVLNLLRENKLYVKPEIEHAKIEYLVL